MSNNLGCLTINIFFSFELQSAVAVYIPSDQAYPMKYKIFNSHVIIKNYNGTRHFPESATQFDYRYGSSTPYKAMSFLKRLH